MSNSAFTLMYWKRGAEWACDIDERAMCLQCARDWANYIFWLE